MGRDTTTGARATSTPDDTSTARLLLMGAALGATLAWMASRLVLAQFQGYDDEGYLLVSVQQFLQGAPLYDDVYTQYGPAYYIWQYFLHGALGIPVTNDATRIVTVAMWLVCSALLGVPVWLLTRRRLLTALGVAIAFFHLTQLTFEPGHPQEICLLGVTGAVALAVWRLSSYGHLGVPAAAALGGLVAFTILTKVNVGALLLGAMTLALTLGLHGSKWRTVLVPSVMVSALAGVPVLMHRDLLRPDVAGFTMVLLSGLLAAFMAARSDRTEGAVAARELTVAALAAIAVSGAVVVAVVARNTTLGALFDGLFVWPLRLPEVFWRPLPANSLAAVAAAALAIASLCARFGVAPLRRWLPPVTLASGLVIVLLSTLKAFGPLLATGPALAWLALGDSSSAPGARTARLVLVFASILLTLQAYPMPEGTQSVIGTVLFVPMAFVMLADAERVLRHSRPQAAPTRSRRIVFAAVVVMVAATVGLRVQRLYAGAVPLGTTGAEAVRASERDVATYRWLVANLQEHCDAFLSAPGLNSLHVWTGLPPVSPLNATLWPILFDDAQQARVVAAAQSVSRLCVAWDPRRMAVLTSTPTVAMAPLVAWLVREFEPVAGFGDWEFRVRRGRRPDLLYQGRWRDDGELVLDLPGLGPDPATRLALVELDTGRTLGDSANENAIVVTDEDGRPLSLTQGIDVSRRRRLVVRAAASGDALATAAPAVVRLMSSDSRPLAIVPIVSAIRSGAAEP